MTGSSVPRHPKIEVEVDETLARDLLLEQHPDLADLPLRGRVHGWDNLTWRLGDDLALRFPVRELSAALVVAEQTWLPRLAPMLPVAVPTPVRHGRPGPRYPWPWSVLPWLPGTVAAATDVAGRTAWATELADALAALHVPAPDDAPVNAFRGVPLAARDAVVAARLEDGALPHADALRSAWADGLAAPPYAGTAVWVHGDPHPGNLLAHGTRLGGLIDFGDLCSGDPASDLATAWMTFDERGRAAFVRRARERSGWDDATWRRARAWAAAMVPMLTAHPVEYPLMAAVGRHTAAQVALG
ncbi:aminoglycoside phosphotransferase family protein [Cellulomonas sp. DKR-3]|uniref:Aminoglycoside phosphotransferase family protein n=1 Tax=Cellulomonas fulva TaxID=2835530 RepID=A0ABS5U0T7_9CELL|nr:aminoglycoside phosphotransferase family protein [Cellulomonas fulva]MBT0994916.1 aminoglycoside phosphotransferase family protein [Cellulomonas fulva]